MVDGSWCLHVDLKEHWKFWQPFLCFDHWEFWTLAWEGAELWQYLEGPEGGSGDRISGDFPVGPEVDCPEPRSKWGKQWRKSQERNGSAQSLGNSCLGKPGWGVRKVGSGQIQNRKFLAWFLGTVGSSLLQGLGDVALERTGRLILWPNVTWKQHSLSAHCYFAESMIEVKSVLGLKIKSRVKSAERRAISKFLN